VRALEPDLAAFTGGVLAGCAALAVLRFLPRQIVQHGAMRSGVSAAEDVAELALAGARPVFADTPSDAEAAQREETAART
jgi:hypothetical protein